MLPTERLLLFGHVRSGSTSLYQILQLHPDLNILEEPFNEDFVNWDPGNKNYRDLIHDVASLEEQLAQIFAVYDGLTLLAYQLDDNLIRHLLLRAHCRVVFLRRRNYLQAAVSNSIARQTNLWHRSDMTHPLERYYENLQPLDLDDLKQQVMDLKWWMNHLGSLLDTRADGRVFKVVYEDLYFAPPEEQLEMIGAIWRFLEIKPFWSECVDYHLRPGALKLNSEATYAFVPNAREVDRLCGGDDGGWLFERPRRAV